MELTLRFPETFSVDGKVPVLHPGLLERIPSRRRLTERAHVCVVTLRRVGTRHERLHRC